MRSHLLITNFNAYAISVLFRKILPCASKFKPAMHFLFSQIQDLWSYAEVIDPPGVEFCAG